MNRNCLAQATSSLVRHAICALCLLSAQASFADSLLNGCTINDHNDSQGNPIFFEVRSQGRAVLWLKQAEVGSYANAGKTSVLTGLITNSDALEACKAKGLDLPTKEDFQALQNCFESVVTPMSPQIADREDPKFLTQKGDGDLNLKFPDMAGKTFWTSTPVRGWNETAWVFNNLPISSSGQTYGGNLGSDDTFNSNSVRCVQH